jgi:uncharacterized Ntn-hydrolase superfamily protein
MASQNITDPRLGIAGLDQLEAGLSAAEALKKVKERAGDTVEYRQLALVDNKGRVAAFSGEHTLGIYAIAEGPDVVAAGNLLAGPYICAAILESFADTGKFELGDRLVAALTAGLEAGGEAGPVHSAGMLVADREAWPVTDLRVDWSENPVHELAGIWEIWKPQAQDYVLRGLNPASSPAYGVPGEE